MPNFSVIMPAAGKSSRFTDKHYKKPFVPLANRAVWLHSAEKFLNRDDVKQLMIVVAEEDLQWFQDKFSANVTILGVEVIRGGATRTESVAAALNHLRDDIEFVAVHDAARPCLVDAWIEKIFAKAMEVGAAMPAIPVTHTLKRASVAEGVESTVSREGLWQGQTPQVFRRDWIEQAYAQRGEDSATDDAHLVEKTGHPIAIVLGSNMNIKLTTKEDLRIAEALLKVLPKPKLSGPGHPFTDDLWR